MRSRLTGRDGDRIMIYEPDGRTPWMLLEVVNGFVMRSENANTAGPIPVDGRITVYTALSDDEEIAVYNQAAMARLTTIDGLVKFLKERLEAAGT